MNLFARLKCEWIYFVSITRLLLRLKQVVKHPERTIGDQIADLAVTFCDRTALIGEETSLTYAELDHLANRYARWALSVGIAKGDVVGVMMLNRPEFVAAWLGITRAGGVAALINTNQRSGPLAHSIRIVAPRHLVLDAALLEAFATARGQLETPPTIWVTGSAHAKDGENSLDEALAAVSQENLGAEEKPVLTTDDPCLYIYTSGTTGLPKAATISHYRVMAIMNGFSSVMQARPDDRIYVPLPLYHSSGGLLGVGATLTVGGAAIIPLSFSVSDFWRDCVKHEATLFQYIGELCRYLVNAPPCEEEKRHSLRMICGNGLRPDIWRSFQKRFAIPRIIEFYGATEGNVILINYDGHEGALGRLPRWTRGIFPVALVKFDANAGRPFRDANGRCVRCAAGEIGEAIGSIERDAKKPASRFDGYANNADTEQKILRDVFAKGDMWFRTGDLMRIDETEYLYFVDRIGDTFRWKGENVSTSEVAVAISGFDGIGEANVYGVEVAGREGRAGMVMLVPRDGEIDLASLTDHLSQVLPAYARPVFLRISGHIEKTSTFKQRKTDLVEDGFNPAEIADQIYFADPVSGVYRRLDQNTYEKICSGEMRI